jgi:predicted RNA methylase
VSLFLGSSNNFQFHCSSVELEQIPTSAHIASRMIFTAANQYEDIENCSIGDFGCGTGMLSIACNALGPNNVIGFDIDEAALETAWINCKTLEIADIDFVNTNVEHLAISHRKLFDKPFHSLFLLCVCLLFN